MRTSRVTSNSALILVSEVADRVLRFLLVIVAARLLGATDFGRLSFAIYFCSLFLIVADLGIHQWLIREIARKASEAQRLIGNGLVLKLTLAVITFSAIYATTQLTDKPSDVKLAVYIIAGALVAGSFADFFSTVFQGLQRMKYYAVASLIMSTTNTVIGISILVMKGGFLGLAWAYLAARLLKLVYCIAIVHLKFARIRLSCQMPALLQIVKESFSFGIARFFSMIYTYVDTTMLSLMINDTVVGWYQAAYRLIYAMMVLPMGIMRAVYPALSAYHKSNEEAFQALFTKAFKFMLIAGTSLATILFVLSDQIVDLLFGEDYIEAPKALRILVWSTAIYSAGTVMTHATRAAGHQNFTARVVAASAVLNVVLNVILIPRYSFVGAAFATLCSEFFTFVFHFWFVGRYMIRPPLFELLPKVAAINLGTFLIASLAIDFPVFVTIALVVPAHASLVYFTKFFSGEDLKGIRSLIRVARGSQ